MPMWRLRPALPMLTLIQSRLPSWPMVARQALRTRRISPEGKITTDHSPSLAPSRPTLGSENVCLLAILILDQRDKAASVRVVFDAFDLGGHIVLHPLEVNHAI